MHAEEFDPYVGGLKVAGVGVYRWEWAVAAVWQDPNGVLRLYVDSGCSCSSPYDRVTSWEDIPRLSTVRDFATAAWNVGVGTDRVPATKIVDEMRKVDAALGKVT